MASLPNHRSTPRKCISSGSSSEEHCQCYHRPRLVDLGSLHQIIQGNSWKGIDSYGELDPQQLE